MLFNLTKSKLNLGHSEAFYCPLFMQMTSDEFHHILKIDQWQTQTCRFEEMDIQKCL